MRARPALLLAAAAVVTGFAGCGGGPGEERPRLIVSAAASLGTAFTAYAERYDAATVRLSFGASDELAAQIRRGVRPDVFAAANTRLVDALHGEGLVERPRTIATNRLVIAVPAANPAEVRAVEDLARPGVAIVVGAPRAPVGGYARDAIARLAPGLRQRVAANIRSEEPDVIGVVGKLTQGAADAGFVYATDVRAAGGRLRAIDLPPDAQPSVAYAAAVVRGGPRPVEAERFLDGLASGVGAAALRDAGFGPPPAR